jgi:predicted nucleotidyltransferase
VTTSTQYETFRESWRPTQEKVDLLVKAVIELAHPSRVFLFGSWPRGESTPESDLDLAVFVANDRENEIGELHNKIRHGLRGIPMSIDLIIASESKVAEYLRSVNSVYYKIVHRGKLVYDNADRSASGNAA